MKHPNDCYYEPNCWRGYMNTALAIMKSGAKRWLGLFLSAILLASAVMPVLPQQTAKAVAYQQPYPASSWGDINGYPHSQVLSFNGTGFASNVVNQNVLVVLTASNFNFSSANVDGQDITFVAMDDVTVLPTENVSFNQASEYAEFYVTVNITAYSDYTDFIRMYWGNMSATGSQRPPLSWDSNYVLVSHLRDNPTTSTLADSTVNSNNGTKYADSNPSQQNPPPSSSQLFDGANSYINFGSKSNLDDISNVTFEAWVYPTGWGEGGVGRVLDKNQRSIFFTDSVVLYYYQSFSPTFGRWSVGNGGQNGNNLVLNQWLYIAITADSSNATIPQFFLNGANMTIVGVSQAPAGLARSDNASDLYVGNTAARDSTTQGKIGEVRISRTKRTAAEIYFEWLSLSQNLIHFSGETAAPTLLTTQVDISSSTFNGTLSSQGGNDNTFLWFNYGSDNTVSNHTLKQSTTAVNLLSQYPNNPTHIVAPLMPNGDLLLSSSYGSIATGSNITGHRSSDGGLTWSGNSTLVGTGLGRIALQPNFVTDNVTGTVFMVWADWASINDCKLRVSKSVDNGQTFTAGTLIPISDNGSNYDIPASTSGFQHSNGTLIIPVGYWSQAVPSYLFQATMVYSTDHGNTWLQGGVTPGAETIPANSGFLDISIFEATDGSLYELIRTEGTGKAYYSISNDVGLTWSTGIASNITASNQPIVAWRQSFNPNLTYVMWDNAASNIYPLTLARITDGLTVTGNTTIKDGVFSATPTIAFNSSNNSGVITWWYRPISGVNLGRTIYFTPSYFFGDNPAVGNFSSVAVDTYRPLYYQAMAQNGFGIVSGDVLYIGALASITTLPANSIAVTKDGLVTGNFTGNITSLGDPQVNYWWDFAKTAAFDEMQTANITDNSTGTKTMAFSSSNLTPGGILHTRFAATNLDGTTYGSDEPFTLTMPTVSTLQMTDASKQNTVLNGTLDNMGVATNCYVTMEYWSTVPVVTAPMNTGWDTYAAPGAITKTVAVPTDWMDINSRIVAKVGDIYVYGATVSHSFADPLSDVGMGLAILIIVMLAMGFMKTKDLKR